MIDFDLSAIDTQRVGRMGELVVELALLSRGWLVGNFNATTTNSVGWDLFATKGARSVKIRVKAKRPGTTSFVWSKRGDGRVFAMATDGDPDDFVAAVSFDDDGKADIYVMPSAEVEADLLASAREWLAGEKRGGGVRKETPALRVHMDDRMDTAGHGFAIRWAPYRNCWSALEAG